MLDTRDGRRRVLYVSPGAMLYPAVSPDGTRLAYAGGRVQWNVLEVGVPDGRVRTLVATGGISWLPEWNPSGTRYLFATNRSGQWAIEEASSSDGLSRRVIEETGANSFGQARWAPDGSRFVVQVNTTGGTRLLVANASGGRTSVVDPQADATTASGLWSPDGQHVLYTRVRPGTPERQLARIRPGSAASVEVLAAYPLEIPARVRLPVAWSPTREWVLMGGGLSGERGLFLAAPDFRSERPLTRRVFEAMGFSKDGRAVLAILRNSSGTGPPWQLWSVDVATGRETRLADLDLPAATDDVRGFSLHPDGTRFATSIAIWPFDIWMLEGFEGLSQPKR
jgi:Tol biopolymer transport system component